MIDVILTLLGLPGIGRGSVRDFLKLASNKKDSLYDLDEVINDIMRQNTRIKLPTNTELGAVKDSVTRIRETCLALNITILTPVDLSYPARFLSMSDYPVILFAKGNVQCLNDEKNVAIIGTRKPSEPGREMAHKLGKWFAKNDYIVTSGLALGCDSEAHRGCLIAGGKTVAILANGLDTVSPKSNEELAEEIISAEGCLLSEYAPGEKAIRGHFVERDRLQSALSQGVIVVESGIDSGSMHAVNAGIKQGRRIACVRFSGNSIAHQEGNLTLINEGKAVGIASKEDLDRFKDSLTHAGKAMGISTLKSQQDSQISLFD